MLGRLAVCAVVLSALGCGSEKRRDAPIPAGAAAVVVDKPFIFIATIDRPGVTRTRSYAEVPAGEHEVKVVYQTRVNGINAFATIRFVAESGHRYIVRDSAVRYGFLRELSEEIRHGFVEQARFWLVDDSSNEEVGQVVESWGEPLIPGSTVTFRGSISWPVPVSATKMNLARRRDGMDVYWNGANRREFNMASIRVDSDTASGSEERLTENVRASIQPSQPSSSIRVLEERIEALADRGGRCVRYHQASLRLVEPSMPTITPLDVVLYRMYTRRALLDRYGFSCWMTGNRGRVSFEYLHGSFEEKIDPETKASAEKYFNDLRF